jgi:hypothetical protein
VVRRRGRRKRADERKLRRNPIAKAVRRLVPKVKPKKRRPPPETKDWDG